MEEETPTTIACKQLRENQVKAITHALKNKFLGDAEARMLANALQANTSLQRLWLGENQIGDEGTKALASAIQSSTILKELFLQNNQIGGEGAKALANALQVNTCLQELSLKGNQIGAEGAKALATALHSNTTLIFLDLKENQIGDDGGRALLNALQGFNSTLTAIMMDRNGLGPTIQKEIRFLAKANKRGMRIVGPFIWKEECARLRRDDTSLLRLDFDHLPVGVAGAKALADALKNNAYLRELSLEGAGLGIEGAKALTSALQENRHLQKLYLSNNEIGADGVKALVCAIMSNTSLEELYLSRSKIGDEGAKMVANALAHNSSLKKLVIEENNIGADGGIALQQGIASNSSRTLVKMSVKGNNIPIHILQEIESLLPLEDEPSSAGPVEKKLKVAEDADDEDNNTPLSSLSEKQQQEATHTQKKTTPSDLLFPPHIFGKMLEFSPDRLVHNAIGGTNRELLALTQEYDTPWPDNTILSSSSTNIRCFGRSRLNQSSYGAFTVDSKRLVLTELTELGSTPQHRAMQIWDIRKGLVLRQTFAAFSGICVSPCAHCTVECYGGSESRRDKTIRVHSIDHSISTGAVSISKTIQDGNDLLFRYGDDIDFFFSPDGGLMCGIHEYKILVFDLKNGQCIMQTIDRNIHIHKNSHPFLINNSFMVWGQRHHAGVAVTTLRDLNGDPMNADNMRCIENGLLLGRMDSFSQCPVDESLVVSARREIDDVSSQDEGGDETKVQHSLTTLKFWRPCEACDFDRNNDGEIGDPDGILYKAKSLDTITFTTTKMEGLLIDREEIPRHKQRMVWFSDGIHLVYFDYREIHSFRVNAAMGYISKVSEDSKSLPSMLLEKANQVIEAKVPKEMYIDWMLIAPNSRTLVMRLCRFPGNEITRIVSI